jgi:predicted nucleotidyltransferase
VRYCALVRERLGDGHERLVLFGSAARGAMWDAGSPMHSDIDLLVVTREPLPDEVAEQLLNETYPLYLESGRQIGPQFRAAVQHAVRRRDIEGAVADGGGREDRATIAGRTQCELRHLVRLTPCRGPRAPSPARTPTARPAHPMTAG